MLKNNKKGFTLVELLAVIVILAVILAIAVPSISTVMGSAKKSAFEDNVKLIIKGVDYKVLEAQAAGTAEPTTGVTNVQGTLGSYGANKDDYTTFILTSTDPTTISLTGATTGKFGACSVTNATLSNIKQSGTPGDDGVISGC
jgi:type IV pilus assembly protein PilA